MNTIEWLRDIIERNEIENFTIAEALKECKNTFDLLCIVGYLLDDIVNLTRYEIETEQQQKDFNELIKVKDIILNIKNKNA